MPRPFGHPTCWMTSALVAPKGMGGVRPAAIAAAIERNPTAVKRAAPKIDCHHITDGLHFIQSIETSTRLRFRRLVRRWRVPPRLRCEVRGSSSVRLSLRSLLFKSPCGVYRSTLRRVWVVNPSCPGDIASAMSPASWSQAMGLQGLFGGAGDDFAGGLKPRAVTGTVPRLLRRIPLHDTA
jgi:hypothetical protein